MAEQCRGGGVNSWIPGWGLDVLRGLDCGPEEVLWLDKNSREHFTSRWEAYNQAEADETEFGVRTIQWKSDTYGLGEKGRRGTESLALDLISYYPEDYFLFLCITERNLAQELTFSHMSRKPSSPQCKITFW